MTITPRPRTDSQWIALGATIMAALLLAIGLVLVVLPALTS